MKSLIRALGWIVKGLLLLLAVATLVLWPMSRGKYFLARSEKFTVGLERVDLVTVEIGCANGRVWASHQSDHYLRGEDLTMGRGMARAQGVEWRWKTACGETTYLLNLDESWDGWGPLRWYFFSRDSTTDAHESRDIAIGCWLIALLLALWPLVSFTLFVRRRTRRRRRIATGCCLRCGYDLRGSPRRCPECGLETGEYPGPPPE